MNLKRKFWGDSYVDRTSVLKHLYYRIIFLRGWFIDFPILIVVSYLIPWDKFYGYEVVKKFVMFMESYIPNIQKNRIHSDFPEFAITYLSFIHLLGFICLLFPFFYSKTTKEVNDYLIKSKNHPLKVIFFGIATTLIFLIPPLYVGAVTYFGCYKCSYHYQISLIAGAIFPWCLLNLFFLITLMVVKNYFSSKQEI